MRSKDLKRRDRKEGRRDIPCRGADRKTRRKMERDFAKHMETAQNNYWAVNDALCKMRLKIRWKAAIRILFRVTMADEKARQGK